MEIQLKELIDKIKSEGVETANEKAAEIIKNADQQAAQIVFKARQKAEEIITEAEHAMKIKKKSAEDALKQAARDLLLQLKKQIHLLFAKLIEEDVQSALSDHFMEKLITDLVKSWNKDDENDLQMDLIISENEGAEMLKHLRSKLSKQLKQGMEIHPSPHFKSGFRVMEKDGSAYIDFSGNSLADILTNFLNPGIAELLKSDSASMGE